MGSYVLQILVSSFIHSFIHSFSCRLLFRKTGVPWPILCRSFPNRNRPVLFSFFYTAAFLTDDFGWFERLSEAHLFGRRH